MIVPSTVKVKNWQAPYLVESWRFKVEGYLDTSFWNSDWHPLRRNPFIVLIAIQQCF